jgi:multiple sugar transport system substrate-binding protein
LLDADSSFPLDDFAPRSLDMFRYEGDQWGLPLQSQVRAVFYNPQLFDAAGVPYPQPGWTMEDFLATAQALTQGEGEKKRYGFLPLNGHTSDFIPFLAMQGASPWDDQDQPRFDDPAVVAAVRWYANLALVYGVMPNMPGENGDPGPGRIEVLYALVRAGQVAMWSDFTGLDRSDIWPVGVQVGIVPMPVAEPGEAGITNFVPSAFFISAQASHPEACWEWIRYLSNCPEIVTGLPVRHSVIESTAWATQAGAAAAAYRASQDYADVRYPANPQAAEQMGLLHQAVADILQGGEPEVVLGRAQQEAEQ